MSANVVYVTLVRPGKDAKTVEVPKGNTIRDAFIAAEIESSVFSGWTITDEDGDALRLDDTLTSSTTLICGAKVDGATPTTF